MTNAYNLYIPVADQQALTAVEDRQRQARLERQRRYRDASREKIRAAGRAHYHANRTRILALQAAYHRSEAGRATMQRANAKRRPKDPLQKLAVKLNSLTKKTHTDMKKITTPRSSRPQWLKDFLKQEGIDLKTLRRISKLLAARREADRGLAQIEAQLVANAKKA